MKKQIFITALAIMFGTLYSTAQNKGDIELGIGFGGQVSTLYNSGIENDQSKVLESLSTGISAEYYLSEHLGIKMNVRYDPKGWSNSIILTLGEDDEDIYEKTSYSFNYLTIPVTANWHFGTNKNWYLNLGPYVGFILNARDSTFGIDLTEDTYKDTDFGIAYGIGYKFKVRDRVNLFFEFDAQQGLLNIYKYDATVKNFRMGVNFGALFSL